MTTTKQLQTATARAALKARGKPYFVATAVEGLAVGYRRLAGKAGTWTLRKADEKGGNWTEKLGAADDLEPANGTTVLDFAQATAKAIKVVGARPTGGGQVTVEEAITAYEKDITSRGRNGYNARRVKTLLERLPLWKAPVASLTTRELKKFRDELDLEPVTKKRTLKPLKAALNLAAKDSEGAITNVHAWKDGLKVTAKEQPREIPPLSPETVMAIVDAAYRRDEALGLFVEVGAETGARPSQIAAIRCCDLEGDSLLVPSSKKGREGKPATRNAVPITAGLAKRLRYCKEGREANSALLLRDGSNPWVPENHEYRPHVVAIVAELGLPKEVTFTALRSAAISRMIFAGVPVRLIAAQLDTSVSIIENHYTAKIAGAEQAQMRRGLLERKPKLRVVT